MTPPIGERPGMAAYGTDTADWQALPWEWAAERLVPNRNYWVVTVSAAGAPHCLPVWGVWDDGDLRLMFSYACASRKARTIAPTHRVVFTEAATVDHFSIDCPPAPISNALRAKTW